MAYVGQFHQIRIANSPRSHRDHHPRMSQVPRSLRPGRWRSRSKASAPGPWRWIPRWRKRCRRSESGTGRRGLQCEGRTVTGTHNSDLMLVTYGCLQRCNSFVWDSRRWFTTVRNTGNYHNFLFLIVSLDSLWNSWWISTVSTVSKAWGNFWHVREIPWKFSGIPCNAQRREGSQVALTACDFVEGHGCHGLGILAWNEDLNISQHGLTWITRKIQEVYEYTNDLYSWVNMSMLR